MLSVQRPDLLPDPALSREEMEALQREIAAEASFENDLSFDPAAVTDGPLSTPGEGPPLVAGVDQAFLDDRAISAIVVSRGGEIVERVYAVSELSIPYIPGLLSFREGGPIVDAVAELTVEPDLVLFDGSGRIHFREAGLATHMGVVFDVPSVGVAKSLLCGTPTDTTDNLPEGARVPIEADADVTAAAGTVIGHAVQTRQYDSGNRSINPLIVSPGHRVDADTAAALVAALTDGYKLPEPTRRADAYAEEAKSLFDG
ncbi:Endonuclease V [Natronoarchaeum philippinense]|uniref:Endonuclease V n=1 Tax=Natronoarchaeum philippinense TaxID=558529 RepID=A0A285NU74_NATPI|nr:endonuclease V [Natronoarchaeum philippinense]SNZ13042.1 Endonuclease V [Natronoarchaeum philippinense]